MLGSILAIASQAISETDPGGNWHVIEFYSRRQRRVTRSTFSAELHGFADALEIGKMLAMLFTEVYTPNITPRELVRADETGALAISMDGVIDAKSVFDALSVADIRPPTEASLVMILLSIKEAMLTQTLKTLWWCDTVDMCADGLNKGAVPRTALLEVASVGKWVVRKPAVSFCEKVHRPALSSAAWYIGVEHLLKIKLELRNSLSSVFLLLRDPLVRDSLSSRGVNPGIPAALAQAALASGIFPEGYSP